MAEGASQIPQLPADMAKWSTEQLAACVHDHSEKLAQRMRAVFYLRTQSGDEGVKALCTAVQDPAGSCLFRHEVAFVLGQMRNSLAIPTLTEILQDTKDDAIVRHECAEALGAIADPQSIPILERFASDPAPEVSETCQLAVERMTWATQQGSADEAKAPEDSPFESVDPAPPAEGLTVEELRSALLDESLPLFKRYRAMFALRNLGDSPAVAALCDGLTQDNSSALFRHEVAYVLGQLEHPESTSALRSALLREGEHAMVRHEAAEALGAIGTPEANALLQEHKADEEQVVRESCEVALDAAEYWEGVMAAKQGGEGGGETA